MSAAVSFLTPDDLAPLKDLLEQVLKNQQAAARPTEAYLSIAQVAKLTGHHAKTVRKWISEGKADKYGNILTLYTLEFSPGYVRVPHSALVAFGQAVGFDAAQLALPATGVLPGPTRRQVLDSKDALRKSA